MLKCFGYPATTRDVAIVFLTSHTDRFHISNIKTVKFFGFQQRLRGITYSNERLQKRLFHNGVSWREKAFSQVAQNYE